MFASAFIFYVHLLFRVCFALYTLFLYFWKAAKSGADYTATLKFRSFPNLFLFVPQILLYFALLICQHHYVNKMVLN